jgi:hypothetical protein
MSDNTSDPRRIERDLDQTRSRLDTHLSALQNRLSPGQVVDDLMSYFRGSEGADFGRNLLESVRSNPLPAAVTGIGLAWLMTVNPRPGAASQTATTGSGVRVLRGPSTQGSYEAMTSRMRTAEQGVVRTSGEVGPAYAARLDDARGQAIGLARQAQETTESFGQRIRDALTAAQQAVVEGAHDLCDQASGVAGSVGSAAQGAVHSIGGAAQRAGGAMTQGGQAAGQAGGNLVTTIAENPMLLGALGLAAGALLGALLPQSDREEAALGDIAGQARDTARSLAQEVVDRGGHVAQAVVDKGYDSAQTHGLTGGATPGSLVDAAMSGKLAGEAKQVVADVLHTGDEAIRKETLGQGQGVTPSK